MVRHSRRCAVARGGVCSCQPGYQAQVWSSRDRRTIRKTFATLADARAWRQESQVAIRKGTLLVGSKLSFQEVAAAWLQAARAGVVRTRSGDPYKPSALRAYEKALRNRVVPVFGARQLGAITRLMLQDFVDELVAQGLPASTVSNTIMPIRAIYRRAEQREEVHANPTQRLSLPAVRARRERIASPAEAESLIAALPSAERALWATALYAGLRTGELQALQWPQIDFERGLVHVTQSWDARAGLIDTKSRAGVREIPIIPQLRSILAEHQQSQSSPNRGFVFLNQHRTRPFNPPTVRARARDAWAASGLRPIQLHECRHSYASYLIAAGVNTKALSAYMGHASVTITLDRYGHLLPGHETEAAQLLERWLEQAVQRPNPVEPPVMAPGISGLPALAL